MTEPRIDLLAKRRARRLVRQDDASTTPCFTPGTGITTPRGLIAAEELGVGDRVLTRDNGIQTIRWVGSKEIRLPEIESYPHLRPVLIQKDAFGPGLPMKDTLVSPNHRMLITGDHAANTFGEREVLVSAKHLVGTAGVSEAQVLGTTYIHFMFEHHEVVLANGAWSESFQPGDHSLKGLGSEQRAEILSLFPELATDAGRDNYLAARRVLSGGEARRLMR
ncbi:Hint domain-containing protein [Anianabacter salinae]|uniref:Hint domain-containing protein n=1 Tax=Anianabacter salinae TaxID=2851023 RepID=UPI00225E2F93|nr:Hint domain-containing protein [Anianabacter salinae]MBV0912074.1 Hint domain-containing protein [Anianabacter salinae]